MRTAIFLMALSLAVKADAQPPSSSGPDALIAAGLPSGTMFGADDHGHFTSCVPPPGEKRTPQFKEACSKFLAARGKASGVSPINPQSWKLERPASAPLGATGTSVVRLSVSTEGSVESCSVITSSGYPVLDEAACEQLPPQAHFRPATDHDGNPLASTYTRPVTWR
jgi:TonB family protein